MQGTTPPATSCTSSLPGSDAPVSAPVGLGSPQGSQFSLGPIGEKGTGTALGHSVTSKVQWESWAVNDYVVELTSH